MVQTPSPGDLQTQSDKALSNLVWIQCWHCFELNAGLETSWGPFHPERLWDSMSPVTGSIMHYNGKGFTEVLTFGSLEPVFAPWTSEKHHFTVCMVQLKTCTISLCSHREHLGARKRCFHQAVSCLRELRIATKCMQAKRALIKGEIRNADSKAQWIITNS